MMIEQHTPRTVTFTVTAVASEQFHKGDPIDCDIDGQHVAGTVGKVEIGNRVAIVVVDLPKE